MPRADRPRTSHADVRFVAASVSVRCGHDWPDGDDSLAAHRIIAEHDAVRIALLRYRSAQAEVYAAINDAISAEIEAGTIPRQCG